VKTDVFKHFCKIFRDRHGLTFEHYVACVPWVALYIRYGGGYGILIERDSTELINDLLNESRKVEVATKPSRVVYRERWFRW
jgi:hypothetical protein